MRYNTILMATLYCTVNYSYAIGNGFYSNNLPSESDTATQSTSELKDFEQYTGVVGTGIKKLTITSTGASIEQTPSGTQSYLFFTQTLANSFYYEGRLYGKYNYTAQNPVFPTIPTSNENVPAGYGVSGKFGYNFHVTNTLEMTPYLRINAYRNMSVAYADSNGNYINSYTLALLPGMKLTFKLLPTFTPYIDVYGGYQQVYLDGNFTQGSKSNQTITSTIYQWSVTDEFGFAYKVNDNITLLPYIQYITTQNSPDAVAALPYNQGGFNISELTSTQQVFGLKLSVSW